jgi:flotillin
MKSILSANSVETLMITIFIILLVLSAAAIVFVSLRLKKCPADKIMVVYGYLGKGVSSVCIHGGTKLVLPFIQAYQFLDLTPISINIDLKKAPSRQNVRVDVSADFTVAVSNEQGVMQNAAERLLWLPADEIKRIAKDIIFGQIRLAVAATDIEEIVADRDKFLSVVCGNVEGELKKIGLKLLGVGLNDIDDEDGYIDALGRAEALKDIDRDRFIEAVFKNAEIGLKKVGLRLIGLNVKDIDGGNGRIYAIAKEAGSAEEKEN